MKRGKREDIDQALPESNQTFLSKYEIRAGKNIFSYSDLPSKMCTRMFEDGKAVAAHIVLRCFKQ